MKTEKSIQKSILIAGMALAFALSAGGSVAFAADESKPVAVTTAGPVGKPVAVHADSSQSTDKKRKQEFWKNLVRSRHLSWLSGDLKAPTDTIETADEVRLNMEVPGLDDSVLDITVARDEVTVKGEKAIDMTQKPEDFRRMERAYGSFEKTVQLPAEVDADRSTATLHNGILTIMMPKAPAAQNEGKKLTISR